MQKPFSPVLLVLGLLTFLSVFLVLLGGSLTLFGVSHYGSLVLSSGLVVLFSCMLLALAFQFFRESRDKLFLRHHVAQSHWQKEQLEERVEQAWQAYLLFLEQGDERPLSLLAQPACMTGLRQWRAERLTARERIEVRLQGKPTVTLSDFGEEPDRFVATRVQDGQLYATTPLGEQAWQFHRDKNLKQQNLFEKPCWSMVVALMTFSYRAGEGWQLVAIAPRSPDSAYPVPRFEKTVRA